MNQFWQLKIAMAGVDGGVEPDFVTIIRSASFKHNNCDSRHSMFSALGVAIPIVNDYEKTTAETVILFDECWRLAGGCRYLAIVLSSSISIYVMIK